MRLLNLKTVVAVFSVALLSAFPETSWGHAFPDHADPKVGSIVSAAPTRVRIWFDSELEPAFSTIMVHAADGWMADKGDGRVNPNDATLLEISLPPLPVGVYRVIWSVVARDGHRTSGDYTFSIK